MSAHPFSMPTFWPRWLVHVALVLGLSGMALAVRAQEGTRQWRSFVTAPVYSSPSLATDGTLYVGVEATSAAKT
jgi:outer membrane protein assembly factor BamB